jgi:hypothetical protein
VATNPHHHESHVVKGNHGHSFGRTRYNRHRLTFVNPPAEHTGKEQPLPKPTGAPPFRLDLKNVITPEQYKAIEDSQHMVFHTAGDTGGIKDPHPQEFVAAAMEEDFYEHPADLSINPAFFYQLGDCVYFNGQAIDYYSQFYEPYEHYLSPILAVPGNHDGDAIPPETSLEAFVRNYCQKNPGFHSPDAHDIPRTAMNQPNVYWTLMTPLARIIGLYTNVPAGGFIGQQQLTWLEDELKDAKQAGTAIIVTMHHPVYSADDHHSGSPAIHTALTTAIDKSGVHPDLVLAGHVHDYQRFTRQDPHGSERIYVVAGAGGYHNLHKIAKVNGEKPPFGTSLNVNGDVVTLESYVDDRNGFLRVDVSNEYIVGKYYTVNKTSEGPGPAKLADTFRIDWQKDRTM